MTNTQTSVAPSTPQTPQEAHNTRKIPARRMSLDEALSEVPRHFAHEGTIVGGHVMASLSSLFPDGEDFFVRSVRHYRDQITDPVLKKQVGGFIGQEAIHGREHRVFNARLAELGYPTKAYEKMTLQGLKFYEKVAGKKRCLALTAALEHFTASIAETLLTDEWTRTETGHPAVRDLFVWHALEESEHKAVAFDVYRAIGGDERTRIQVMNGMRVFFPVLIVAMTTISVALDPEAYRHPIKLVRSIRRVLTSPLMGKELYHTLALYCRKGFHPDDIDTDDLVAEWTDTLFGPSGTLNDKLAGSSAA